MANRAWLKGTGCQLEARFDQARLLRNGTDVTLCGQPARFVWYGFDPRFLSKTVAERKRYIRTQHLVCIDHTLRILHNYGWHIKDRKARLERIDVIKFRAHCQSCGSNLIVQWDADAPAPYPGSPFRWCPQCGARALFGVDADLDAWEVMSEDLAKAGVHFPVPLLKMLYEDWPRNVYPRFYEYVKHQVEVFERTGEFEPA